MAGSGNAEFLAWTQFCLFADLIDFAQFSYSSAVFPGDFAEGIAFTDFVVFAGGNLCFLLFDLAEVIEIGWADAQFFGRTGEILERDDIPWVDLLPQKTDFKMQMTTT